MSDHIINIITENPYNIISNEKLIQATNYLKEEVPADDIKSFYFKTPIFVDCGADLKSIACPICGHEINLDYWTQVMDKAYKTNFNNLNIIVPCCHNKTSLNDLKYHLPCAFSCIKIEISNPKKSLSKDNIQHIEIIFDCPIDIINSHL